jgi:hypothetical protein
MKPLVDRKFPTNLSWARKKWGDTVAEDFRDVNIGNTEGAAEAMATLEATLKAESWFFDRVIEKLEEARPQDDYQILPAGQDHLLHFAQFLFFLKALDCTSADSVLELLDNHNDMIDAELASPIPSRSMSELKKAKFGDTRKKKIAAGIRALNRPVFAISEYGHLLIDSMSAKTAENLIEDLRISGLLVELHDNSINADQKRKLYASSGFLEDIYERSLLVQRRFIADTFDADEFARIKGV